MKQYKLSLTHIDPIEAVNQIEEVLNEFDFKEVHKVMEFLNWEYAIIAPSDCSRGRIPNKAYLKKLVNNYLIDIINALDAAIDVKPGKKRYTFQTGTGGFYYTADWYKKASTVKEAGEYGAGRHLYLDVKFCTTTWDTAI
jgi:hypothetical protein